MSTSSSSSSSSGSNSSSSSSTSSSTTTSLSSPSPTTVQSSSSVVVLEGSISAGTIALTEIEIIPSDVIDDSSVLITTPPGNECITTDNALSGCEIIGEGGINSTTLIAHSPEQQITNNISISGPLTPTSSSTPTNCDSGGDTTSLLQQQPITPPNLLNVATPTSANVQDCIENNNNNNLLLDNISNDSLSPSGQTSSTNINNGTSVSCDIGGSLAKANLKNSNNSNSSNNDNSNSNSDTIDNNNIVENTLSISSPLSLVASSSPGTVPPFAGLESTTLSSPLSPLTSAGLMSNIKEEPHTTPTTPTSSSSTTGNSLIGESSSSKHIKLEDDVISSVNTPPSVGIKKEPIQQQQINANSSSNVSSLMSINSGNNNGNGNNNSSTNNNNNNNNNIIGSTNTGSIHLNSGNGGGNGGDKGSNDNSITDDILSTKGDLLTDPLVGLVSLANIKKEEPGPDISPDGFGPLGGNSGGNITGSGHLLNTGRGSVSSGGGNGGPGSNIITGINSVGGGGNGIGCNQILPPVNISGGGGVGKQSTGGSGGGGGMTSMDYSMQQQNHIFVFSTQLANRGAESVLSGQYPTIIAYHCAQPNTKKFLEDFFQKNPMKLSKINRQNLVTGQWMNNSNHNNVLAKMASQQHNKPIGGSVGNNNNNPTSSTVSQNNNNNNNNPATSVATGGSLPGSTTTTVRMGPKSSNSNSTQGFGGPEDMSVGPDATDLLSWDPSGNHLGLDALANGGGGNTSSCGPQSGSGGSVGPEVMDDSLVPDSPSLGGSGPQRSCNNMTPISSATTVSASSANIQQSPNIAGGPVSPGEGLQPSLQGVKVPDENLTPQQRQHREEQLAKLKKMNQFLFPEHGGMGEFVPPHLGGEVPPNSAGGKMMPGVGQQAVGPGNMMSGNPSCGPQSNLPVMTSGMLRGSNMMGMGPRNAMCRPTGMGGGPMAMSTDVSMMGGGGSHNNGPQGMNDMSGMQCGGMMMGNNQSGPGGGGGQPTMMGGGGPGSMGVMMGGPGGPLGHQSGGSMNCGMGNPGGPGGVGMVMGQKPHMGMGGGPGMAQMEWSKLQHQFYEERKGKGMDGMNNLVGMCPNMPPGRQMPQGPMRSNSHQAGNGSRSQGPPPPYHQTPRSASVPIATQSPNPGSPNNPTSNLSLPSPRTGSTLNSPAGDGSTQGNCNNGNNKSFKQDSPITAGGSGGNNNTARQSLSHSSNPGTPISHMSPNASLKDLELGGSSVLNSSSGNSSQGKDASLMPVPSPQQIRYLNAFEGQELTIQKQPNTLLKENGISVAMSSPSNHRNKNNFGAISQSSQSTGMDSRYQTAQGCGGIYPMVPISSICNSHIPNLLGNSNNCDKNQRINSSSGPSPQGSRTPQMGGASGDINNPSSIDSRFPPASPGMNFSPVTGGPSNQQTPGNGVGNNGGVGISIGGNNGNSQQQSNVMKMGGNGGFMDVSPNGKCSTSTSDTPTSGANFCVRSDNMPLNPNSNCPPPTKTMEFDPISSLAQMSQQLTSSVSNALNGQPGGPGNGGPVMGGGMGGGFPNHPGGGGMGVPSDMQMGGMGGVESMMGGPGSMDPCGLGGGMPHNMGGPGQYGMHGPNPGGMGPMGMMGGPPGGPRSLSPKLGGTGMVGFAGGPGGMGMPQHRMMGRPGMGGSPYNGANIQVKASTPNTIQYLPARPQVSNSNPRVPPSLEFLQRFANPQMSGMDGGANVQNKMQNQSGVQGMNFYPNCNQMQGPMGGMGSHMDSGMGGPDGMMGMGPGGQMGGMNQQNIMMRGLRPPGQGGMIRMQVPMGGGPGQHHHPFSNGPGGPNGPGGDPSSMFPVSQMFGPGSKGNPMANPGGPNGPQQMSGGGPPDASQPLPPSMVGSGGPGNPGGPGGPGNNFKSSQFVGPSTADPNYAQQFHNFQQQLYATSTRSHMNNQPGNNGPPGGMPGNGGPSGLTGPIGPSNPNQTYFVPK